MVKPPLLALTIGDPCGIGPEIVAKTLSSLPIALARRLIAIGPIDHLKKTFLSLGLSEPIWRSYENAPFDGLRFISIDNNETYDYGEVCSHGGDAAIKAVQIAHELCVQGICAGMITGPIGKKAIRLAGSTYSGHTDMLCALAGVKTTRMAMVFNKMRVVMTTLHVSFREVPKLLTKQTVFETLQLAHEAFSEKIKPFPVIAVSGLNPHAGEDGLFGDEEKVIIKPAIEEFRKVNPNVSGPFPADILFKREMLKSTDVFVTQTHDQGLIPIKAFGGIRCVNVTLGLPYVRTSVGHGTAYDIAGTGLADPSGLLQAIKLGFRLCKKK
ncbi:4-hydroxythreonine-4-phosphate dehydrogenase PdxA [bacterium]|nr:4-hydroxythreonine-4-phosphate dehydrogenase PdxA [bacterium]